MKGTLVGIIDCHSKFYIFCGYLVNLNCVTSLCLSPWAALVTSG